MMTLTDRYKGLLTTHQFTKSSPYLTETAAIRRLILSLTLSCVTPNMSTSRSPQLTDTFLTGTEATHTVITREDHPSPAVSEQCDNVPKVVVGDLIYSESLKQSTRSESALSESDCIHSYVSIFKFKITNGKLLEQYLLCN